MNFKIFLTLFWMIISYPLFAQRNFIAHYTRSFPNFDSIYTLTLESDKCIINSCYWDPATANAYSKDSIVCEADTLYIKHDSCGWIYSTTEGIFAHTPKCRKYHITTELNQNRLIARFNLDKLSRSNEKMNWLPIKIGKYNDLCEYYVYIYDDWPYRTEYHIYISQNLGIPICVNRIFGRKEKEDFNIQSVSTIMLYKIE